jgi:uncharacterized protein YqhQ
VSFLRLLGESFSVVDSTESHREVGAGFILLSATLVALVLFVLVPQMVASALAPDPETLGFVLIKLAAQLALVCGYLGALRLSSAWRSSFRLQSALVRALGAFESGADLQLETVRRGLPGRSRDQLSSAVFLLFVVLVISATAQTVGWTSWTKALIVLPAMMISEEWLRLGLRLSGRVGAVVLLPYALLSALLRMDPRERELQAAILALRHAVRLEKGVPSPRRQSTEGQNIEQAPGFEEFEIHRLVELGSVRADPKEFLE